MFDTEFFLKIQFLKSSKIRNMFLSSWSVNISPSLCVHVSVSLVYLFRKPVVIQLCVHRELPHQYGVLFQLFSHTAHPFIFYPVFLHDVQNMQLAIKIGTPWRRQTTHMEFTLQEEGSVMRKWAAFNTFLKNMRSQRYLQYVWIKMLFSRFPMQVLHFNVGTWWKVVVVSHW